MQESCRGRVNKNLLASIVSLKESTIRDRDAHSTEFRIKPVWTTSTVIHAEQVYPAL